MPANIIDQTRYADGAVGIRLTIESPRPLPASALQHVRYVLEQIEALADHLTDFYSVKESEHD